MSLALAAMVSVPETLPPVGDAIDAVGGVVSAGGVVTLLMVTVTAADCPALPAASNAFA